MGLTLITAPAVEPVSLDDVKSHLYITDPSVDELVTLYSLTARQIMESDKWPGLGVALITQTWDYTFDVWPEDQNHFVEIPKPPIQSIVSITQIDINGNSTVTSWPNSAFFLDPTGPLGPGTGPARLFAPNGWPTISLRLAAGITIRFTAGFGDDGSAVPSQLRTAQMMLTGTYFENREATGDMATPVPRVPVEPPFGYSVLTRLYGGDGFA